jgi:hypothetical protein
LCRNFPADFANNIEALLDFRGVIIQLLVELVRFRGMKRSLKLTVGLEVPVAEKAVSHRVCGLTLKGFPQISRINMEALLDFRGVIINCWLGL